MVWMKVWGFVLTLLVGIALGVAGAILVVAPEIAGPLLPQSFLAKGQLVEGEVERKMREGDRLLLTMQTSQGTVLATFRKKVPEIDLLVQKGDTLTLGLQRYAPFADDPTIERVRKPEPAPRSKADEPLPPAAKEATPQEKPSP